MGAGAAGVGTFLFDCAGVADFRLPYRSIESVALLEEVIVDALTILLLLLSISGFEWFGGCVDFK